MRISRFTFSRRQLYTLLIIGVLTSGSLLNAQSIETQKLYDSYDQYKETSIEGRRFKHEDIRPLIDRVRGHPEIAIKDLGSSIGGRKLSLISYGQGERSVFLWSQMHGNEPTATMAIFDILNFLTTNDSYDSWKSHLGSELTIHFLPMVNPDGAEYFQRRNLLGVDLNRDALRLQSPEARILKSVRDSLDADWGFNLHDQSRYLTSGRSANSASISFLAPAFNYEKDVNFVRERAIKLIGVLVNTLEHFIPDNLAKYSDEFEPRAFGDNMQKWGTSTILIESGGLKDDREKQELRQLHFVALLKALESIADKSYEQMSEQIYEQLPFNQYNVMHDLIIRNGQVVINEKEYVVDLAFRQNESNFGPEFRRYILRGAIQDLGDLSTSYAYREMDASNMVLDTAKTYPVVFRSLRELEESLTLGMLREGYGCFVVDSDSELRDVEHLPVAVKNEEGQCDKEILPGHNPVILLKRDGEVRAMVVNGRLIQMETAENQIKRL